MRLARRLARITHLALAATLACSGVAGQAADGVVGYYRMPAVHGADLVFVAEGDLWSVGVAGGQARQLTAHAGLETSPAISPDGRTLAFVGQYDGAKGPAFGDVYAMPLGGGVPKRLSWAGRGVRVWGFAADGEIVYTAPSRSGQPGTQLYLVDPQTGVTRELPVDQASDGALSADGRWLYFTRHGLRGDNARHYRGGAIARLWALDLQASTEAQPLIPEGNNDRRPMPYRTAAGEDRVAFLSDRGGDCNLWSVKADGSDLRQLTHHRGWDIRDAASDGQRIAYTLGADVHLLELASGNEAPVAITLGGDFDQQRERFIARPQDFLGPVALAPDGQRVLLNVRGHLATQGTGAWRRAELPQPPDGRCRDGAFSADGRSVFAMCDFSGEVEVWKFAANGLGKPEQITSDAQILRTALAPSPDGRWLAHTDKNGHLYLTELRTRETRRVDTGGLLHEDPELRWSPDSKALAFARDGRVGERAQLALYLLGENRMIALNSERYDNAAPAFSPDGHWLYFLSDREFQTTAVGGPWGDRNMGPDFPRRTKIYALALQQGLRWPFAAPDELAAASAAAGKPAAPRPAASAAAADAKDAKADDTDDKKKTAATLAAGVRAPTIVETGLASRLYEVPLPAGDYSALSTDGKRLWWLESSGRPGAKPQLDTLAIDNQGGRPEAISGEIDQYALSADTKKLLIARGQGTPEILVVDAGARLPGDLEHARVRWSDWQVATEPRAEWRQMFNDAWRLHRDYFFDAQMRGVDWQAVRRKYEPLAARVTDRAELGDLMGQMSSEVGILHSQIGLPDLRSGEPGPAQAALGARFTKQAEGWRLEHVYATDPERPDTAAPLAAPGLDFRAGDVITSINGRATREVADLAELLQGQAGHQVLVEYRRDGAAKPRQAIVTPVDAGRDAALRYGDWVAERARRVDAAGQGRLGYIHLNAMGPEDVDEFAREFYAQIDRDGLIIDVRSNNGGNVDSWMLGTLLRRAWMFWQPRSPEGAPPAPNMQQVFRGRLVILVNEETYSDGETFSEGFKRLGLGTVIGKRTSGAGVWLSDGNLLVDKGHARAAEYAQLTPAGEQIIEGVGVTPDLVVENPPRATFAGQDAQLDAGIHELERLIAAQPPLPLPTPRPYPRQQP
ncbi:MAG: PD40 domain-containing protein [Pelomonas sp.]|nr:PD40 domain-containing protein [Roseateles sp.]